MGFPVLRLVLLCVLVAGAAGAVPADRPFATGDPPLATDDPSFATGDSPIASIGLPADGLTVAGDSGDVDAQRAYRRLQDLYDRDLPALTAQFYSAGGFDLRESHPDRFFGLLADPTIRIERSVQGFAIEGQASVSYREGTAPALVERVLVHELAHALQPPDLREEMESAAGDYAATTDAFMARQAAAEGPATFVTDAYAERYLDVPGQSERLAREWPTMTDATRLLWAPYRYGADHARARASSPANLSVVYADPPLTTEQVLHPSGAEVERAPLAVASNGSVAGFDRTAADTMGELYLRVLLASELSPDRAARAAAGWGNDRLVTYAGDANVSFAWVLQWDSRRDASQFEAAMGEYLDAVATRRGAGWVDGDAAFRLDCVSGRVCYVLAGDPGFVRSARVTANTSGVVVS